MIELGYSRGEIQLLEVKAGSKTFGYLYNFVLDGMVSNYQSSFLYQEDGKYKPGLLSRALAIAYNQGLGHKSYDLLMGDQQFKRSLTVDNAKMVNLVVRQNRIKLVLESKLKKIWSRIN